MLLEMVVLTEAQRLHPGWKKLDGVLVAEHCQGTLQQEPPTLPLTPKGKPAKCSIMTII